MSFLSRYRKTVIAVLGAAVTWLVAAFADNHIDTQEWVALAVAIATALGVYGVANTPPAGEPSDPSISEQGYGLVELLVAVLLVILIIWVLLALVGR